MDQLFKDKLGQDRHYEIPAAYTADLDKRLAARGSGKSRKGLWIFSSVVLIALLSFTAIYFATDSTNSSNEVVNNDSQDNGQTTTSSDITTSESSNEQNGSSSYNSDQLAEAVDNTSSNLDGEESNTSTSANGTSSSLSSSGSGSSTFSGSTSGSTSSGNSSSKNGGNSHSGGSSGSNTSGTSGSTSGTPVGTTSGESGTNPVISGTRNTEGNTGDNSGDSSDNSTEDSSKGEGTISDKGTSTDHGNNTTGVETDDSSGNQSGDNGKDQTVITPLTDGKEDLVNATEKDSSDISQREEDNLNNADSTDISENVEADSTAINQPEVEINNDPKPKKVIFELYGFGGIDLTQAKLTAADPESGNTFNQNQLSKITGQYGLGMNMNFNRFYAGIGLSMNSYKDEVYYDSWDYNTTFTDSVVFTTVDSIVYDSTMMPIDTITYTIPFDTLQIANTDSTSTSNLATNTYKILAIPVSFGYTFGYKDWAFRPRLSAIFELNRQSIIANYPMSANNNTLEQLNSLQFGMSMAFDFQIQRNFGNLHVYLRPGYRFRLTNMAESNSGSSIRHNSFQTVVGLGYYFGH
jgi:hypothetical protein